MGGVEWSLTVVETLLQTGADVNVRRRPNGISALDNAATAGHVSILKAILEHGVDVDSCDGDGCLTLHRTAKSNQVSAIDAVVEAWANTERKSIEGRTPLFYTTLFNKKSKAMPTLLRHGAIASTFDDLGLTPLNQVYFRKYPGLEWNMDLLLRWGAAETALDNNGETPGTKLDELPPAGIGGSLTDVERVRLLLKYPRPGRQSLASTVLDGHASFPLYEGRGKRL
ncbi:unnamed protein product [Ectocarpus sp. 13 AM-2016]